MTVVGTLKVNISAMSVYIAHQKILDGKVAITLMTNKKFRVKVFGAFSDVDIENLINNFLVKNPCIEVKSVNVTTELFENNTMCLFTGVVEYFK